MVSKFPRHVPRAVALDVSLPCFFDPMLGPSRYGGSQPATFFGLYKISDGRLLH
jgi:hypothetical protein